MLSKLFRPKWPRRWRRWLLVIWPQWPLTLALVLIGALNILKGLRYDLFPFAKIGPLSTFAESLAVLGSTTQIILGVGLVLVGIGLLWRLSTAWAFAVLMVAVTVGVDLFRGQRGVTLALPCLMLFALIVLRRYFTRRTVLASYLISLFSILAIAAYGTFGTYLLGSGFKPAIHDLTSAFYFTVITLSTVGYGDITPTTQETRLFTVSLLVVGVSIFAAAVVSTLWPAISGELDRIFNPKEKAMKPEDHVILVGEGPIAHNTARELNNRGIAYVQIVSQGSEGATGAEVIKGDASDDNTLREANIESARMVIAARDDDGENAFIALVAKDLNPEVRVLAVASTAHSIRRLKLARADLVFSPAAVGSRLLANLVEGNQISPEFQDLLQGRPRKD